MNEDDVWVPPLRKLLGAKVEATLMYNRSGTPKKAWRVHGEYGTTMGEIRLHPRTKRWYFRAQSGWHWRPEQLRAVARFLAGLLKDEPPLA